MTIRGDNDNDTIINIGSYSEIDGGNGADVIDNSCVDSGVIYAAINGGDDNDSIRNEEIFAELTKNAVHEELSLDSTFVKVHRHGLGAKKGHQIRNSNNS